MSLKQVEVGRIKYNLMERTKSKEDAKSMADGINYRRGKGKAIVKKDGDYFIVLAKPVTEKELRNKPSFLGITPRMPRLR